MFLSLLTYYPAPSSDSPVSQIKSKRQTTQKTGSKGIKRNLHGKLSIASMFIMMVMLSVSCEKNTLTRIGFTSDIEPESNGLTMMWVDHQESSLILQGEINVSEGGVTFLLTDPDGFRVYELELEGPQQLNVDRTFPAKKGYWKLSYTSSNGVGDVQIHLSQLSF